MFPVPRIINFLPAVPRIATQPAPINTGLTTSTENGPTVETLDVIQGTVIRTNVYIIQLPTLEYIESIATAFE